jgi:hypothetical protein
MKPRLQRYLGIVAQQQTILTQAQSVSSIAQAISAALSVAEQNAKLAETAITDPTVLKETPQRGGRGLVVVPLDTPTTQPTSDPTRTLPPASTATATTRPPEPTATNTVVPPAPTRTATAVLPTPTVANTVTTQPTALPRIQFSGVIERIAEGEWVVDGRTLRIDAQTQIDGAQSARIGARADVVAINQPEQELLALSIKVYPLVDRPTANVVRGVILSMSATSWNLSGQKITLDSATLIHGNPALGLIAEATGTRKGGDTLTASTITVKGPAPEIQVEGRIDRITIQAWVIGGQTLTIVPGLTAVSGPAAVGNNAVVSALRLDNGSLVARQITVQAPVTEEEFEGTISRIEAGAWTVNGRRIIIGRNTQVDDSQASAQVGQRCRVRGVLQADGSIVATSIRLLASSGTGRTATPTPVSSPTPTASPTATTSPIVIVPQPTVTRGAAGTPIVGVTPTTPPAPRPPAPAATIAPPKRADLGVIVQ